MPRPLFPPPNPTITPRNAPFCAEGALKTDSFGSIEHGRVGGSDGPRAIHRDTGRARWWAWPLAVVLARRERLALGRLAGLPGVPRMLQEQPRHLRSFISGHTIEQRPPKTSHWYAQARRLLREIHNRGVTHNDTHKEPNWLVTDGGEPALVDFQLASRFRRRTRWFRLLALEDLRHLLKHKRKYCPESLTARERRLLQRSSWPARWWRRVGKPPYRWFTRRVLRRRDNEGRGILGAPQPDVTPAAPRPAHCPPSRLP